MRILGIDPGYGIVGFGVIDDNMGNLTPIDYGAIETDKSMRLVERLAIIEKSLEDILDTYKPEIVAIEELFFFKNQKTIIPVAEARGVIINYCFKRGVQIFEYTPLQIKQALTGFGRAEKQQVQYMTKSILNLNEIPKPDDAADALAVAICQSQTSKALNTNQI